MSTYLPVQYVYREVIEEDIKKRVRGKIFYFDRNDQVASAEGSISGLREEKSRGYFIDIDPEGEIRIDRIITLFGKPGPAYDEYDRFANACMDCSGGDE